MQVPSGKFTFVGTVPITLMDAKEPTKNDVMAGRVHEGKAYSTKSFESVEAAIALAKEVGADLCVRQGCACRQLFN